MVDDGLHLVREVETAEVRVFAVGGENGRG